MIFCLLSKRLLQLPILRINSDHIYSQIFIFTLSSSSHQDTIPLSKNVIFRCKFIVSFLYHICALFVLRLCCVCEICFAWIVPDFEKTMRDIIIVFQKNRILSLKLWWFTLCFLEVYACLNACIACSFDCYCGCDLICLIQKIGFNFPLGFYVLLVFAVVVVVAVKFLLCKTSNLNSKKTIKK